MFVCCIATHLWCLKFCNPNQLSWCTFFYSEKCITLNETGLVSTTNPPLLPKKGANNAPIPKWGRTTPQTPKGGWQPVSFRMNKRYRGYHSFISVNCPEKTNWNWGNLLLKKNKVKSIHSIGPLHLPMFIVNRLRFFSEKIVKPKIEVWKALLSAENTITTKGFATPIQVTRYIWSVVISVTGLWNKKFAIFPNSA